MTVSLPFIYHYLKMSSSLSLSWTFFSLAYIPAKRCKPEWNGATLHHNHHQSMSVIPIFKQHWCRCSSAVFLSCLSGRRAAAVPHSGRSEETFFPGSWSCHTPSSHTRSYQYYIHYLPATSCLFLLPGSTTVRTWLSFLSNLSPTLTYVMSLYLFLNLSALKCFSWLMLKRFFLWFSIKIPNFVNVSNSFQYS